MPLEEGTWVKKGEREARLKRQFRHGRGMVKMDQNDEGGGVWSSNM